jgi:Flp pilus assembly protein TadD
MKSLAFAASTALLLAACSGSPAQEQRPTTEAGRNLRVAAAAERGGQPDVALSIYAAAAEANPADPEIATRYATALMQAGQPQQARTALTEARRRNPGNAVLLQAEGRALLELGEAAAALALFDQHLQSSPRDARSMNGRGIALDLLGRHAEARLAYRAARLADPGNNLATGNLALSLMLSGCAEAAMALLESSPRDASTAGWIGQMQGLARTLTPSGGSEAGAVALRSALPASSEPCAAA